MCYPPFWVGPQQRSSCLVSLEPIQRDQDHQIQMQRKALHADQQMKRTSLCSRAGAPNLQDLMPAHLKQSWYNNRNNVHNKCNVIESSSNQPPGPWKICLPGNQSLVPKSWELLLRFFERPSAGLLYKIWGGVEGRRLSLGRGRGAEFSQGSRGSATQILPSPGPVPLPRSATILNWAVWVGCRRFHSEPWSEVSSAAPPHVVP